MGLRLPAPVDIFADLVLMHSRFHAANVRPASQTTFIMGNTPGRMMATAVGSMIGNQIAAKRAERMSAPQWRQPYAARTFITRAGIICLVDGIWSGYELGRIVQISPELQSYSVVFTFANGDAPLRLAGPWAPWSAVALAYLAIGRDDLARNPGYAALGPLNPQVQPPAARPMLQE
ncbi:hypothetical protein [Bailinhaonella thermotolerans]|uniref:hypothetical protein n=1 Tax=Bailinhaonella thermotolerans TaxID=1070861 RepID=UPI0011C386F5|nr:hypothetical protein [Bailinhaonella thermotolerans]